jgi:hypothetical protein
MQLPKQKLPLTKKNDQWYKDSMKALINESSFASGQKSKLFDLYNAYNGHLETSDYNYVISPYGAKAPKRGYPAKLRSYNIIKPIVDLLLGEKSKRSANYQVLCHNRDVVSKKQEDEYKATLNYLKQRYVNELNDQGVQTGMPSKEQVEPEAFKKAFDSSYKDARAIKGQHALTALSIDLDLDDRFQEAFFDWVVSGYVYSYKGVCMNSVDYEVVSPFDLDYAKTDSVTFIEDSDWQVRRKRMSVNQVVDKFYDILGEKDLERLENPTTSNDGGFSLDFLDSREDREHSDRTVEVLHVCWKSFRKIGFLSYTDEMGQPQEMTVDENYKLDRDAGETIDWVWVNQAMEGYRLDGDIYLGLGPCQVQRTQLENYSICKLPYNGRKYSDRHSDNISIVSMGVPYQILYNVFHYRLELSIAKNKDKIMLMEINAIPKRHGWDEEKFMYFADAMGFAFIDSTAEGKSGERVSFNQFQVLDMSLGQYIAAQFELLQAIKQEWEDLVGFNRQRKGQVMATDGVGSTERAVFQSSLITEELFRKFEKFEEKERLGLLDTSKVAWKDGKKFQYIGSDLDQVFVELEASELSEVSFGVYVKNSARESEKLQQLRGMIQAFSQNGAKPSTIAEILDMDHFATIKTKLAQVERLQEEIEGQQAQQAEQAQMQMQEAQAQQKEAEQIFESTENQLDRDKDIYIAEMKEMGNGHKHQNDVNKNGIKDELDKRKLDLIERKVKNDELKTRKEKK